MVPAGPHPSQATIGQIGEQPRFGRATPTAAARKIIGTMGWRARVGDDFAHRVHAECVPDKTRTLCEFKPGSCSGPTHMLTALPQPGCRRTIPGLDCGGGLSARPKAAARSRRRPTAAICTSGSVFYWGNSPLTAPAGSRRRSFARKTHVPPRFPSAWCSRASSPRPWYA